MGKKDNNICLTLYSGGYDSRMFPYIPDFLPC